MTILILYLYFGASSLSSRLKKHRVQASTEGITRLRLNRVTTDSSGRPTIRTRQAQTFLGSKYIHSFVIMYRSDRRNASLKICTVALNLLSAGFVLKVAGQQLVDRGTNGTLTHIPHDSLSFSPQYPVSPDSGDAPPTPTFEHEDYGVDAEETSAQPGQGDNNDGYDAVSDDGYDCDGFFEDDLFRLGQSNNSVHNKEVMVRTNRQFSRNDYKTVLGLTWRFYEAQRSGKLPSSNRVSWRKSSHEDDKVPGGWYDAGDYLKLNFPLSYTVTMLSWGMIEFEDGYRRSGEFHRSLDILRPAVEYLKDCHISKDKYIGQIGHPGALMTGCGGLIQCVLCIFKV